MRLAVKFVLDVSTGVGDVGVAVVEFRFVGVGEAELPSPNCEPIEVTIPPAIEGVFKGTAVPPTSDIRKQTFQHVNIISTPRS